MIKWHAETRMNDALISCMIVFFVIVLPWGVTRAFPRPVDTVEAVYPLGTVTHVSHELGRLSDLTTVTTDTGYVPLRGLVRVPIGAVVERWTTNNGDSWIGIYHKGDIVYQGLEVQ